MKIGIFGFGAVGSALYSELNEYKDLYILVDENRLNKYQSNPIIINDKEYYPNYVTKGIMDIIIVCVKNYNLESSLKDIERFVDNNTIILPLLNGIRSHDILSNYFKNNTILYGVINIEANKVNNKCITSKIINLQYGYEYNYEYKYPLNELKEIFDRYNVNNNIYENLKRRIWMKWALNIGINQISALLNYTYKDMSNPLIIELLDNIFDEVFLVSKEYNIGLLDSDIKELKESIRNFNSNRVTSLTIDFYNNDLNELDEFGYTLLKLAKEKNISVPVNETLYRLTKSLDMKRKRQAK